MIVWTNQLDVLHEKELDNWEDEQYENLMEKDKWQNKQK